uniref:Uncharacterized protein n=1 Tax=Rhizophora mucronata TaxID=61149 RepID=A0A2P2N3C8_RHIMU
MYKDQFSTQEKINRIQIVYTIETCLKQLEMLWHYHVSRNSNSCQPNQPSDYISIIAHRSCSKRTLLLVCIHNNTKNQKKQ